MEEKVEAGEEDQKEVQARAEGLNWGCMKGTDSLR